MDEQRYWFGPKQYGYGISPQTWEGWAVTFGFVAMDIFFGNWLPERAGAGGTILGCVVLIALFFWIVSLTSSPEV